jgi:di/tricarboxylate transporter
LIGNIASGRMHLDWGNLWTIVGAVIFLAAVVFIFILYFRDNELGRLESPLGFRQFGFKALGVFIPTVVVLLVIFALIGLSRRALPKRNR